MEPRILHSQAVAPAGVSPWESVRDLICLLMERVVRTSVFLRVPSSDHRIGMIQLSAKEASREVRMHFTFGGKRTALGTLGYVYFHPFRDSELGWR